MQERSFAAALSADRSTSRLTLRIGSVVSRVLCASGGQWAARSRWHPDGIGNSSGLLGRYLTEHISGVGAFGLRRAECDGTSELSIPNFRNRNGKSAAFLRGYGIQGYINPAPDKTLQCTLVCYVIR